MASLRGRPRWPPTCRIRLRAEKRPAKRLAARNRRRFRFRGRRARSTTPMAVLERYLPASTKQALEGVEDPGAWRAPSPSRAAAWQEPRFHDLQQEWVAPPVAAGARWSGDASIAAEPSAATALSEPSPSRRGQGLRRAEPHHQEPGRQDHRHVADRAPGARRAKSVPRLRLMRMAAASMTGDIAVCAIAASDRAARIPRSRRPGRGRTG